MSTIKEIFARNIEENIAPVIYFHQLDPDVALQEVREYVFTTRPTDHGNKQGGIHEQMVSLLNQICVAIEEGHKLPASWISGFFGSGKSSFAKLLGLALDRMELPNGENMRDALMERDDTKHPEELRKAFARLHGLVDSMAVIFDIGTAAKNNESIPHTIYRQTLGKLGYSRHDGVAHFELALEDEALYETFTKLYEEQYQRSWRERRDSALAPQQFRAIYKKMHPEQDDLLETSTFNLHTLNIQTMVSNLSKALERRATGKTVFVVIDEVSQYIAKDHNKMLDLQSFVAEVGGRAKKGNSHFWILVTGQEKLEEEAKESVLFKLQDRFPPELRVHLDRANVREVVRRRLLKKKANSALEQYLTDSQLDSLRLHAYKCETVTREELLDSYPLLPAHIPLFMEITQNIRNSSTRTQSDAGGVRSVLNNIWDLFNRDPVALKNKALGTLLSIDMLYDIIGSSIDGDVQLTLNKIFDKHGAQTMESKVVKAIALLEMNAELESVQPKLLASLLYPSLGASSLQAQVENAIETLRKENWIHYHEKNGWVIQNNAAQEWTRQKNDISIEPKRIQEAILEYQKLIVAEIALPTYLGVRFPLECFWGSDQRISGKGDPTQVTVCFHWATNASIRKDQSAWIARSRQQNKAFHWVSAETNSLEIKVREYEKGQRLIARFKAQGNLPHLQQSLLFREQADGERLAEEIKKELRQVWLGGEIYFDGASTPAAKAGTTFHEALKLEIESKLSLLYHKFAQGHINITDSDFAQLLNPDTSGLGLVFFDDKGGLGIAQNDAGKIVFRCSGSVPTEIYNELEKHSYRTGEQLIRDFGNPPYGYSAKVIKACVLGLMREERIKLSAENNVFTSVKDPGAKSLYEGLREFNKAEIEIRKDVEVTGKDRNAIRKYLFEEKLGLQNVDSDSDKLADLVSKLFPEWKDRVANLQNKMMKLGFGAPAGLGELNTALTDCLKHRQVQKILENLKRNLDVLVRGIALVFELEESLNEATEKELRNLKQVLDNEAVQLKDVQDGGAIAQAYEALNDHLKGTTPWRGYADVRPYAKEIRNYYLGSRKTLLAQQLQVLEECLERIKLRPDWNALNEENQQSVLSLVRTQYMDADEGAVQPSLLVLQQQVNRIREAEARAQKQVDQLVNEVDKGNCGPLGGDPIMPPQKPKLHTVKSGLRNRIVRTPEELDQVLNSIRLKCLEDLKAGISVRFEE